MSDYIQVHCPADGSRQALEVETDEHGRPRVVWCSRALACPECDQSCLRELKNVGYLMLTDVPCFEKKELETLTIDRAVERFEGTPVERLPVLQEGRLVGSLSLGRLAGWKDSGRTERALNMKDWKAVPNGSGLLDFFEPESEFLSPDDEWLDAVELLLKTHRNEAFIVDDDGGFAGIVYARQLLRMAVG